MSDKRSNSETMIRVRLGTKHALDKVAAARGWTRTEAAERAAIKLVRSEGVSIPLDEIRRRSA